MSKKPNSFRRSSMVSASSIQSDHFNRKTSKADFERISECWQVSLQKQGLSLHPNAVAELNKRIKNSSKSPEKAKLNFSNCDIDDLQLNLLVEMLAKKPVISKLDLSGNNLSDDSIALLIKLLKGQVKLVKNVDRDKRVTAAFLSEVVVENNSLPIDSKLLSKLCNLCDSLKVANAQSYIRAKYIDFNAPDIILSPFLIKMWFDVVGKLDHDRISKAFESADISEKAPLGYDELEMILIHGLIIRGVLPSIHEEVRRSSVITDISPIQHILDQVEYQMTAEYSEFHETPSDVVKCSPDAKFDKEISVVTSESIVSPNHNHQPFGGTNSEREALIPQTTIKVSRENSDINMDVDAQDDTNSRDRLYTVQGKHPDNYPNDQFGSPSSVENSNTSRARKRDDSVDSLLVGEFQSPFSTSSPSNNALAHMFKNMENLTETQDGTGYLAMGQDDAGLHKVTVVPSDYVRKIEDTVGDRQFDMENRNVFAINFSNYLTTSQFRSLRVLVLRNNHINDISKLQLYRSFPNVTEVDLAYNQIGKKISDVDLPKKLQRLDISFNQLTDISGVMMCVELRELNASNNCISGLFGLPTKLIRLDISYNKLNSIASLRSLSMCVLIASISAHHNPVIRSLPNSKVFFKSLFANLKELDGIKLFSEKSVIVENPWGLQSPISTNSSVTSEFRSPGSTFLSPGKLTRSEQKKNDEMRSNIYVAKQKNLATSKASYEQALEIMHSGKKKMLKPHEIDNLTKRLYEPKGAANDPRRSISKLSQKPQKKKVSEEGAEDAESAWAGKSKMLKYINEWVSNATDELARIISAFRLATSFLSKERLERQDFDAYSETIDAIKEYPIADLPNRVKFILEAKQKLQNEKIPDISLLLDQIEKSTLLLQQIQTIIMFAVDGNVKFAEGLDMIMSSKLGQYVNENVLKPQNCEYEVHNVSSSSHYWNRQLSSSGEFLYKSKEDLGFDYSNPLNKREISDSDEVETSEILEKMRNRVAAKYLPPEINTELIASSNNPSNSHDISNNLSIFAKNPLREHKTPKHDNQDASSVGSKGGTVSRPFPSRKIDIVFQPNEEESYIDSAEPEAKQNPFYSQNVELSSTHELFPGQKLSFGESPAAKETNNQHRETIDTVYSSNDVVFTPEIAVPVKSISTLTARPHSSPRSIASSDDNKLSGFSTIISEQPRGGEQLVDSIPVDTKSASLITPDSSIPTDNKDMSNPEKATEVEKIEHFADLCIKLSAKDRLKARLDRMRKGVN